MPENKDYRTKAERIAYLKAEIYRLNNTHQEPCKQEMLEVCIKALNERIELILSGVACGATEARRSPNLSLTDFEIEHAI